MAKKEESGLLPLKVDVSDGCRVVVVVRLLCDGEARILQVVTWLVS